MDTLVLNADGNPLSLLPISVIPWTTAIRLITLDKVSVLSNYDDWVVRSPSVTMKVPSVILTKDYVKWNRIVKYSRSNIYLRDNYTCQLCGIKPKVSELTLDHVVPRSHGGKTSWTNIVTCCKKCNEEKGNNRSIRPKVLPVRPSYYQMIALRQKYPIRICDTKWLDFLSWPEDMVELRKPSGKPK